jgi:hypothetical protein
MAERLKAIDCKSIGISYVGSNPTFSKLTYFDGPVSSAKRTVLKTPLR